MKTVGIIAEYNPFHNGHMYQITKAKEVSGADYAIVVMSGNFTQRGTPALLSKYARTEAALLCGADLVIELPVCFASSSAEYFSKGAVSILKSMGTDALCFGSECGDISILNDIADILYAEPPAFVDYLTKSMESGVSFPMARMQALEHYLSETHAYTDTKKQLLSDALKSPNNILGIEYLKAVKSLHASMETYTVKRQGSNYADAVLPQHTFGSATAIRKVIRENKESCNCVGTDCTTTPVVDHTPSLPFSSLISEHLPKESLRILSRELSCNSYMLEEEMSGLLLYKLYSLRDTGYAEFLDVSSSLSDKISTHLEKYISFPQFCDVLKSKEITHSRLSRSLTHILLDIKKEDMSHFVASGYTQYVRILGFKKASSQLLSILKNCNLPVISKLADADKQLNTTAKRQLSQDIFAAHIYDSILAQKTGRPIQNEYRRQIVIV